ncbi:MAG: hypothetical protein ACRCZI_11430 [Cetobacterium sp.]
MNLEHDPQEQSGLYWSDVLLIIGAALTIYSLYIAGLLWWG